MYFIIAAAIIALDQWTKSLVVKHMELGQSIPLIQDVLHLTSHRNTGAAFGILANQRMLFVVITIAVVVGILISLIRIGKSQPRVSLALSMVLGGAIGNFIDRVTTGKVVDFVDVTVINFPIFNVADMAITIGVGLLLLDVLLDSKRKAV
ncbi:MULTISPECIES: signal peptidase II [Brevibacillus]|jgi:signal peptidase II|uniref:Lipoprotein signal peptidase n=2 Tax=Brevibacillus TaxID=55080 RepID=M8EG50_9BACL|nr:signal peptidase II [Brevibacillus borstelensis]EMT54450.1 lipoprotein signal peptidase [Brevibacillus borstelensis AK1]KKX54188.1 signal peptidase [Brevibacillus borstelensis cifa_chp40]MBE5398223.1 signal peptidase II [Brevibacillus borstelensis]MED1746175.1 signal peptidase II [Brevibacillus borstelensis]MED1872702.1 signal peptidase II [Brevibacillus borstelensis]